MTISIQEIELEVTMAVLKMATIKETTFWRSFAEIMYKLSNRYPYITYERILEEAHIRLDEFIKSWNVNLYNRRFHK